jgi:lipopolysaccharide export system permease protein
MYLISRLIVKEWFKALIGAMSVLFLLVTIGDVINGFLQNYQMRRVFFEYILKMPDLAGKMLPISSLLATLFAINKLKSHSELMGILAGGFSVKSIYILVLGCSFSIATFQFLNLGYIVPYANKVKRAEFEKSRKNESKYLARSKIGNEGLIWYKSNNYFTSFKAFDSKNNSLKGVTVFFLSENKLIYSIYKAKSAEFISENKWKLIDIDIIQQLDNDKFPKRRTVNNLIIKLDESPEDFGQFESDITTLNIFNLGNFINRLKETQINSSEYEVMYYEKISLVFICIIFALFPISSVFNPNKRSGGFGKSVVFTLIFTIFFFGIQSAGISLGNNAKLPSYIATLGIPSLFSVYIGLIYLKNRFL